MKNMKITFKDGHKIKFKRYDNFWLADCAIWEHTELHGSLDELRKLKAKIADWFVKNAPDEISDKFIARLLMWEEVKELPFKDRFAHKEGRTDQIVNYFLGDENYSCPIFCDVGYYNYSGNMSFGCDNKSPIALSVRLCLEEK